MRILNGRTTADKIYNFLNTSAEYQDIHPHLAIITDRLDAASEIYICQKIKAGERCGVEVSVHEVKNELDYVDTIQKLSLDNKVHGIIVQQPCKYASFELARATIPCAKDVDGFCANSIFNPCTPQGIIMLLYDYNIEIENKHCVILGRSEIVGRPLVKMLLDHNATVSICHSKTPIEVRDTLLFNADIVFCCTGVANLLRPGMVRNNAIIVDVGITVDENNKLCGDAGHVKDWSATNVAITPVPGGIGPMTVASLMFNVYEAAK